MSICNNGRSKYLRDELVFAGRSVRYIFKIVEIVPIGRLSVRVQVEVMIAKGFPARYVE